MEITYYRNGNVQGTVNNTAAHAQKHGICTHTDTQLYRPKP